MVTKFAQKSQKLILDDITFLSIYEGWIGISEQKWMNSFFKTICINKLKFNNNNTKKSPKNTINITNSFKEDKNYVCKYFFFIFQQKKHVKTMKNLFMNLVITYSNAKNVKKDLRQNLD